MRGVFDEKDFESGRQRRDTELTLSSTTVLGIFFGMVLLCGLFFGLGFAVGRYGPSESAISNLKADSSSELSTIVASTKPKPSATQSKAPEPQSPMAALPAEAQGAVPAADQPVGNAVQGNPYGQPQVKPALPQAEYQASVQRAPASALQPALGPVAGMMVQIAAVSHTEDAEVLVGALRKRGYAVSVRRVPTDSLIHVQIGPFKKRGRGESLEAETAERRV